MIPARHIRSAIVLGVLVAAGIVVTLLMSGNSEAQPRFRDFNPPKNPVAKSIDHTFDFPDEVRAEARRNQQGARSAYAGYVKVFDEHETVSMMIPAAWNDVELSHAVAGDHDSGVKIMASHDLDAYLNNTAPGVTLIATGHSPADDNDLAVLDQHADHASKACGKGRFKRYEYADPFFSGHYDLYTACGKGGSKIVLAAMPVANDVTVLVDAVIQNEADLEAVTKVIESFDVLGEPGHDDHHDHDDEH